MNNVGNVQLTMAFVTRFMSTISPAFVCSNTFTIYSKLLSRCRKRVVDEGRCLYDVVFRLLCDKIWFTVFIVYGELCVIVYEGVNDKTSLGRQPNGFQFCVDWSNTPTYLDQGFEWKAYIGFGCLPKTSKCYEINNDTLKDGRHHSFLLHSGSL